MKDRIVRFTFDLTVEILDGPKSCAESIAFTCSRDLMIALILGAKEPAETIGDALSDMSGDIEGDEDEVIDKIQDLLEKWKDQ